jgi:iron complex transport system permease protein
VKRSVLAAFLLLLLLIAGALGISAGAVSIPLSEVLASLSGGSDPSTRHIVMELRLPRVLLATLVGGGLALSGAVFQALLRNPLAEPYILGVSGGAAVGAVLAIVSGAVAATSWVLPGAAFLGALTAILLVFGVAASAHRGMDVRVLLLAGVVVGAFFSACIAFILAVVDAPTVRSAMIWMMGSLSGANWKSVGIALVYTVPAALILMGLARALNLMATGEEVAGYLGADVEAVKRTAFGVASLVAAAGVAVAGIIGFVGLIVPHAIRLLVGSDHRALLPLSFLGGAAFLALADLVARLALAPSEVPIGVITAFVGVPVFLVLLRRDARR